ncbi:unnamed protein product [Trichogramma brassicae]|uniref:Reverse transcriptase domain-containing protein n=1 Tax=Trichogramma brassicae TaxID=86971 RepID=A0A6H5IVX8_9HYME|nr:unnamed protein product [Trichogramma brassicae]
MQVRNTITTNDIDVFSLAETWMTPGLPTTMCSIPGYKLIRNDRGLRATVTKRKRKHDRKRKNKYMQGGGVACYVRDTIPHRVLHAPQITTINETESLLLELGRGRRKLLVGAVYRRPGGFYLSEFFDAYYSLCHRPYDGVIIAGDFNVDLLSDDYETVHFRRLVMEASLEFVPFGATHHGATFDTAIDSIIVDALDRVTRSVKSLTPYTAAHDSLMIEYRLVDPLPIGDIGFYRDKRGIAVPEFELSLRSALDCVRDLEDVDDMVNGMHGIMLDTLSTFAPLRRRSVRTARAPWFTPALRERCKMRDGLYQRYKRTRDPDLLRRFRQLRQELKRESRTAREAYLLNGLRSCSTKEGRWSYLRRMGISAPQLPSPLTFFAPEELLDHYCAVTTVHQGCSADVLSGIIAMDAQDDLPVFNFRNVTEVEVLSALARVAGRVGTGSGDGLSLAYFSDTLAVLAPVLAFIINVMISSGKYPQLWKKSYIRPLSKVRAPSSPAQTRPVSNLPHLAKVCDRLLTAQITEHLESHSLLSPMQSGFREGFSTQTALIKITEDIRRGVEDRLVTILLLFDFKSAFDMLNHVNLILALRKLNFSPNALSLLHSYLSQRSQAVMDDVGNLTDFRAYTSGVPQGSTPAPILFAVYIDSLTRIFRHCASTHMMFADDLQIYLQCPPSEINSTIAKLNEEAQSVANWAHDNGLMLNISKTKAILFASDQNLMRIPWDLCSRIVLEGTEIRFEDCVKNLGLSMYRSLSWRNHVSVISSRVHGVLHRLRSAAGFLPADIKKILVNTLSYHQRCFTGLSQKRFPSHRSAVILRKTDSPHGADPLYYKAPRTASLDHLFAFSSAIAINKLHLHFHQEHPLPASSLQVPSHLFPYEARQSRVVAAMQDGKLCPCPA